MEPSLTGSFLPTFRTEGPECDFDADPIGYFVLPKTLLPQMVNRIVEGTSLAFALYANVGGKGETPKLCYRLVDEKGALSDWAYGDVFTSQKGTDWFEKALLKSCPTPTHPPTGGCLREGCPPCHQHQQTHTSASHGSLAAWVIGVIGVIILIFAIRAAYLRHLKALPR